MEMENREGPVFHFHFPFLALSVVDPCLARPVSETQLREGRGQKPVEGAAKRSHWFRYRHAE